MVFINDSLTVVIVGDWNRIYVQPDWMAENVFETSEIEVGINMQGAEYTISYRNEGVTVMPSQSTMVFAAWNTDRKTLCYLCECVNCFLSKAFTPQPPAYGLNIDFVGSDGDVFSAVVDSMSDAQEIINSDYEIISTKIQRVLKGDNKMLNMDTEMNGSEVQIHFNEHHEAGTEVPDFRAEYIEAFIKECSRIVGRLGYEMEGET